MKLGWVATPERSGLLREIGYDYIELHLAPFGLETAESLAAAKPRVSGLALPSDVFSLMFPFDMRLVGDAPMTARADAYLGYAAELLAHARAQFVVYGSGWVRNLPPGFDPQRREDQYIASLELVAKRLAGSGVTCVIEPLNKKESDIVNSVDDAVRFAKLVNRPEIRVLADFYHMDEEGEAFDTLVRNKDWIEHIHVADTGRRNPGSGQYPFKAFTDHLRRAGYNSRVTTECVANDDQHMRDSFPFLKAAFR